jgi:hypothetical protein
MIRKLFVVLVVAVVALALYRFRPEVRELWDAARSRWAVLRKATPEGVDASDPQASSEIAQRARAKLERMSDGSGISESFTGQELQSLLEFEYRQLLPAFVDSPRVSIDGDRIRLRVRIPTDRIPSLADLGEVAALLPDTADLDVRGTLLPAEEGRIAFAVDGVSAHRIPLPKRLVPAALEALGRTHRPGLPTDAIELPLPRGVRAAYVRGDSLVLLASARNGTRN